MKRITLICLSLLFSLCLSAQEENINTALLKADITRAGVNSNPYEFNDYTYTPAPKGYKAVYISHYGRHGSRSEWGDAYMKDVISKLDAAEEAGILTQNGKDLLEESRYILAQYNGMDGRLTQRGYREHALLAQRMYARNPEVFRKGSKKIRVETSNVPRCIMSMTSFTNSLTKLQPSLQFHYDTGEKFFAYINNDSSSEVKRECKKRVAELMASTPVDTVSILPYLFSDPVAGHKIVGSVDSFQNNIWLIATSAENFDLEASTFRHLPFDEVYRMYDCRNREFYFRHCNSKEHGAERMALARPLVRNVLEYIDEALEKGNVCADLKFGHDYPLLSLVSFIGIEGVGDVLSWDEIPLHWTGCTMICKASNLQMVFYRNKKGNTLVKFLYNEKESTIRGLSPVSGPYYDWNQVRELLVSRLED